MAEKYIEKTHTKVDKKTKEKSIVTTKYRIDPEFVPANASEICTEFVEAYCIANNEVEWLCDKYKSTTVGKDGKERPYSFISIRTDFCAKFFPELAKATTKKVNYRAAFLAKYDK